MTYGNTSGNILYSYRKNLPHYHRWRDEEQILVVGADFAGYPLKEAVVAHLKAKRLEILDMGVKADSDPDESDLMFHRVRLRVGAMISEGEYERALLFCGTGMGIHIAASKCPHVHAGVVESVPAARRAITGNGVNVLTMGAFYVAPVMVCDVADAYLSAELGDFPPKLETKPDNISSPIIFNKERDTYRQGKVSLFDFQFAK